MIAVEPSKANLAVLARNIRLNRRGNVRIVPAAVSDVSGMGCFHQEIGGAYTGQLAESGDSVNIITIDELAERFQVPDVIKIDIEGAEEKALMGARKVLEMGHPVLYIAVHSRQIAANVISILSSYNYSVRSLNQSDMKDELVAIKIAK